jgi:hypothetical protein
MANITLVPPILLASPHGVQRISGIAGEAITAGCACYVKSDGLIWKTVSIQTLGGQFDGMNVVAAAAGEPITIFQQGSKINIGAHGLAIGAFFYPSDTAGALSDVSLPQAVLLDPPIAKAISATVIEITRMDKPAVTNA